MNYLLIKSGFVVHGTTIITEDILVGGNKILQMGLNLERPTSETPVIDATGKYILPGAIDINRHFLDLVNDIPDFGELNKLNQAQVFNGTTTMIDVVGDRYHENFISNIFKAKEKSKNNLIDYGFHLTFSKLSKSSVEEMDYSYLHEGVSTLLLQVFNIEEVSVKVFESIFKRASKHNLVVVCDLNLPENFKSDTEYVGWSGSVALRKYINVLAQLLELGVAFDNTLLFLNVKFQEELDLIQDGIDKGGDFHGSLRLLFNIGSFRQDNYNEQEVIVGLAAANSLNPIYETEVWELVKNIRFLINPPLYNLAYDEDWQDELVYNRPDAYFYIRNYLSLLYSVGVMQRKISMLKLVDIVSTRPSKLMGLWPQKGVLTPGSDADLVIWNPTFERNLYCSMPNYMHKESKNIKLKGRADFVFVKGKMVYNGEDFCPHASDGEYVFRTSKLY